MPKGKKVRKIFKSADNRISVLAKPGTHGMSQTHCAVMAER